jgi:RNA polymerase sigma-70 factor (ECF subfamily)
VSDGTAQPRWTGPGSIADLYRRYAPWLTARLRGRFGAEAEDIGHDAWLRVAALEGVEAIRHPKAFLLRTATNLALDRIRHREVVARHAAAVSDGDATEADQLEAVLLEDIIGGLPAPLRDVFVLSRFGCLSHEQIGEQLGITPRTVEWRMTKAVKLCAKRLSL